jgi:hypothetical protein
MGKWRLLTCVLILMIISFAGFGTVEAHPVETNLFGMSGLFLASNGTTLPKGTLAVGASMLVISDDDVDGNILPVSVTYGATDTIEIAAAFEVYKSVDGPGGDDSGTGDFFLTGKYALQKESADYPATALGVRLKLPMADAPLGSEETDIALFAAMEMAMKSVRGYLNVDFLITGGDAPNEVNYIVGLKIPYSEKTDFTLELLDVDLVGDMFAGGATFDLGSSLNFGVAVGIGLEEDTSADFAVDGKLTFTF